MPKLDNDGDVWILHLGDDENRFNPDWMTAVADALDEVVAKPEPRALVTSAAGKVWSNGLDLGWLGQNQDRVQEFVDQVHELLARFLAAPLPTVAATVANAENRAASPLPVFVIENRAGSLDPMSAKGNVKPLPI